MSESVLSTTLPNNSVGPAIQKRPVSSIYVEADNNVSQLEHIIYNNDVQLGFNNVAFGGVSNFRLSRQYQFLKQILVKFKITYTRGTSSVATERDIAIRNDYLSYDLIREIRYTCGGTELLRLDGDVMVDIINQQCDTQEKKNMVLKMAGVKINGVTTTANSIDGEVEYQCLLPLPWSNLNAMNRVYPLPLHMLSEPLEIQISLRNRDDVFNFNKVPTDGNAPTIVLNEAKLLFRYGKVGNPEMLKKQVYKYPMTTIFSHNFTIPNEANASVELRSFRKGEVKAIQFHAEEATANNRNNGLKLNNLRLLFNGQEIWKSFGNDQLWDICDNSMPSVYGYREISSASNALFHLRSKSQEMQDADAAGNRLVAEPGQGALAHINYGYVSNLDGFGEKYYYTIPIAEILEKYQASRHGFYLAGDFTKQSIILEFDGLGAAANLKVNYQYTSLYQFDGESALLVF